MTVNVQDTDFFLIQVGNDVYICLGEIVKGENGTDHIKLDATP